MIETRRATVKMMATIIPAVEILVPELVVASPELDCTGDKGGVADGAAGPGDVDEIVDEEVDEKVKEEALVVVEVLRVV